MRIPFTSRVQWLFRWLVSALGTVAVVPVLVYGQNVPGPCFNADVTRGCAPLTITITGCSTDSSNIGYNYGDGTGDTESTTHTYQQPGVFSITQFGNFDQEGDTLTKVNYIEVLATPPLAFTVSPCANNTVAVQITDNVYETYNIDFGDGATQTSLARGATIQHTYSSAAPRTITVTGAYNVGCGGTATQSFTPIATVAQPTISRLEQTSTADATIQFSVNAAFRYQVFQRTGTGSYREVATIPNPPTGVYTQAVTGLTAINTYTFKVRATDACNNQIESVEITTLPVMVTAENDQMRLTWQGAAATYQIYRNDQLIQTANGTSYLDQNVQCANEYCYRIVRQTAGGESVSVEACATAISEKIPPVVENLTATIDGEFPVLTWEVPSGVTVPEFVVFRADSTSEFRRIGKATAASYQDTRANPARTTYCYRVQYTDACGNTSPVSADACPMRLTRNTGSTAALTWNAYREWPLGVNEYVVEKLDAPGNVYASFGTGNATTYTIPDELDSTQQVLRFRIRAVANGTPALESVSNVVEIIQPLQVLVPDAFTPNGDGMNDVFFAYGYFVQFFRIIVYNRWGEAVFSADSLETGWDGTTRGATAPAGTYVYTINVEDFIGRRIVKKGTLTLIR